MVLQAPTGMSDWVGIDLDRFRFLESRAKDLLERFGFEEIRTPLLEAKALFERSVGETTDVVEKQMFTFEPGPEEEALVLRPEFTASIVRALLEHQWYKQKDFFKFYSIGPLFRKERPQKGRLRQFHQINAEILGSPSASVEAELLSFCTQFFQTLGLSSWALHLNSIGCPACRESYKDTLRKRLSTLDIPREFCPVCQTRQTRNILRLLDCKNTPCVETKKKLPKFKDALCVPCQKHWNQVLELSSSFVHPHLVLDDYLVRGFDYYTGVVFEFTSDQLGAQNAFGGGGRYDQLVSDLGGPPIPAAGFALGMERLALILEGQESSSEAGQAGKGLEKNPRPKKLFIIAIEPAQKPYAFALAQALRNDLPHVTVDFDFSDKSVKAQMRKANDSFFSGVLIIGPEEVREGKIKLKNMRTGKQDFVKDIYPKALGSQWAPSSSWVEDAPWRGEGRGEGLPPLQIPAREDVQKIKIQLEGLGIL